jgi:G:T-mismatch repair DNA endonuclease (very short patch repair protein)
LREMGWAVEVVWECQAYKLDESFFQRIRSSLS